MEKVKLNRLKLINQAMMNNLDLKKAIIKAIAYFDIFDYPLTLVEVHKWLYQPDQIYGLSEVLMELEKMSQIESKFGFYFLEGRQVIVRSRLDRYKLAEKKFKIALRAATWLRWLAFVKMIAVCNNVGYNNASKESDIDFFIIVQKKHLWWTRLTVTLVTTLLGIRRKGDKVVDRVCLSFYISSDHLNLEDISLPQVDPYLIYWLATLAPIYDLDSYDGFMQNNAWLKQYLPNLYPTKLNNRRLIKDSFYISFLKSIYKTILNSFIGIWLEGLARVIQLGKVKKYFGSSLDKNNTDVIISTNMLKLHKTDRRDLYKEAWIKKLVNL